MIRVGSVESRSERIRDILGLFTEAPRTPRVINGTASRNLSDFTTGGDADEINPEDTQGEADDDTTDYTDDNEELQTDDPGDDAPDTGDNEGGDEAPDTGGGDDAGGDAGEGGEDGPDTGDDAGGDDFTAGTDGGGDDAGGDAGGTDTGGGGDDAGGKQNFRKENMQKYVLFKRFYNLKTVVDSFVDQLDRKDTNDIFLARSYKDVQKKMKSISSFMYDYLVLKFNNDSYITATYIYEQVKTAVLILLQILDQYKQAVSANNKKPHKS